jgi:DeoR family fructose operon transcriptional repressor
VEQPKQAKRTVRKVEILKLLQENEHLELDDFARRLQVSSSTLRRELNPIIETGYIRIRAGWVSLNLQIGAELPFALRELENEDEKQRIACKALDLIQNGETIFISGGTTTLALAKILPGRRLTVITNSLRVADALVDQPGIELVILGGKVRFDERTMHGHLTEWGAQQLRADKFIYGIQAISVQYGLTHPQIIEVSTDRALAEGATQVIVLADHTKFGKISPAMVIPIQKVHTLITGREIKADFLQELNAQNIQVILA